MEEHETLAENERLLLVAAAVHELGLVPPKCFLQ